MRRSMIAWVFVLAGAAAADAGDEKLGTAIPWEKSIEDAAKRAKKEEKLLLALHVSGHFDRPAFT